MTNGEYETSEFDTLEIFPPDVQQQLEKQPNKYSGKLALLATVACVVTATGVGSAAIDRHEPETASSVNNTGMAVGSTPVVVGVSENYSPELPPDHPSNPLKKASERNKRSKGKSKHGPKQQNSTQQSNKTPLPTHRNPALNTSVATITNHTDRRTDTRKQPGNTTEHHSEGGTTYKPARPNTDTTGGTTPSPALPVTGLPSTDVTGGAAPK